MSRFDDMICGLRQELEIPEQVRERYTGTLAGLPEKRAVSSRKSPRRKMWPVAVAAVLAVGAVGVSAAAYLRWRGLEEQLQITPEQSQKLEEIEMAATPVQSVTQGDVTVTVQQSIVDNYFAHLSFKVEGYEPGEGKEPGFSGQEITVGDGERDYAGAWFGSFYNGLVSGPDGKVVHADDGTPLAEGEIRCYTMADGSLEYHATMMSNQRGTFLNQPIHAEFKDLGYYAAKAGGVEVEAEGTWSFDWELTGSDEMVTYELNEPLGESGATVLRAEMSPISIALTYEFPRTEQTEDAIGEDGEQVSVTTLADPPDFTGVRLKDGTVYVRVTNGGLQGYQGESDIYEKITGFDRVLDIDQVESLLFIKSYPDGFFQPLTEEHLYEVKVG